MKKIGGESGAAAKVSGLLKDAGYNQAIAKNAKETEAKATKPALIYYQRNYKNAAKNIRKLLADQVYAGISYQIRLEQDTNIVIVLGPKDIVAEPEAEPPAPTINITK